MIEPDSSEIVDALLKSYIESLLKVRSITKLRRRAFCTNDCHEKCY